MNIHNLIQIASYLTTSEKYKGHGYWLTYEDDKIKIMYDTYYPNVTVYIKTNGENKLVLLHSGHGIDHEYHPGFWEKYADEVLLPKAVTKRGIRELKRKEQQDAERLAKFGPANDMAIFNL